LKIEIIEFIDSFVRPRVQADGGEVVVSAIDKNEIILTLMGECAVCNCACGLQEWIIAQLQERFGADIQVSFRTKKRYFQDK